MRSATRSAVAQSVRLFFTLGITDEMLDWGEMENGERGVTLTGRVVVFQLQSTMEVEWIGIGGTHPGYGHY